MGMRPPTPFPPNPTSPNPTLCLIPSLHRPIPPPLTPSHPTDRLIFDAFAHPHPRSPFILRTEEGNPLHPRRLGEREESEWAASWTPKPFPLPLIRLTFPHHPIPRPIPHPNFTLAPSPTRSPSQTIAGVTPSRGVLHSMNTPRPPPHFIKRAAPGRGTHPQPCPRPAPHRPATAGGGGGYTHRPALTCVR